MHKKKLIAIFQLFRFELPFTAGVCVVLGEVLALGTLPTFGQVALGFLSFFCIAATALILNDYFDVETDRVNAPSRPLPAGLVAKTEALALAIAVTLAGFFSSLLLGFEAFLVVLFVWVVGFLYNWRFKKSGFFGNLLVAFSVGMTFIFGGLVVGNTFETVVWYLAITTLLVDLAEEIAADALDVEGDRKAGSHSLAVLYGPETAMKISASIFGVVVLGSAAPFIFGWLQWAYLPPILFLDAIIIYSSLNLISSAKPDRINDIRRIYMGGLLVFLVILAIRLVTAQ